MDKCACCSALCCFLLVFCWFLYYTPAPFLNSQVKTPTQKRRANKTTPPTEDATTIRLDPLVSEGARVGESVRRVGTSLLGRAAGLPSEDDGGEGDGVAPVGSPPPPPDPSGVGVALVGA